MTDKAQLDRIEELLNELLLAIIATKNAMNKTNRRLDVVCGQEQKPDFGEILR